MSDIFFDPKIHDTGRRIGDKPTEVVVVDVITNEEHPDYDEAGFNVGTIRFKYLQYGAHLDDLDNAYVASPADVSILEYPLIGEVVSVYKQSGFNYYTRRLNVNKDPRFSTYFNLLERMVPDVDESDRSREIQRVRSGGTNDERSSLEEQPLRNENYNQRPFLHHLKHFDGDIILQNRYGASLRFGSSQMESALNQETDNGENKTILGPTKGENNNNPIIILRTGENEQSNRTTDSPYALTVEDINRDPSSLLLSSDQLINFTFATTNNDSHFRSSQTLNLPYIQPASDSRTPLAGSQGIFNSGRLVFNSKDTDIILSSNRSMNLMTNSDVTIDAGRDNILSSTRDILLRPENGYIVLGTLDSGRGSNFATNPLAQSQGSDTYLSVAIAEPLIEILDRLIGLLTPTAAPGIAPAPPPGSPIIPLWNPQMKALSRELNKIRSNLVRIER